jgi:hypothetical protein
VGCDHAAAALVVVGVGAQAAGSAAAVCVGVGGMSDIYTCECGLPVRMSESWWHRSVCAAYQEQSVTVVGMVEIVARAIAGEEGTNYTGDRAEEWRAYILEAKAAIAAMREPTGAMVDAGASSVWNRDALVAAYQAMIDAALQ